eukprot:Rmarinus@m.1974
MTNLMTNPTRLMTIADPHAQSGERLLTLDGVIAGKPVKVLLDSGATDNFISTRFVEENRLMSATGPADIKVRMADGTIRDDVRKMTTRLTLPGLESSLTFFVFDIDRYEVVLGIPWLKQFNPDRIDW